MSRKHYIEVARVIRHEVDVNAHEYGRDSAAVNALANVADSLADIFKADNSAFDSTRFMDACGLEGDK